MAQLGPKKGTVNNPQGKNQWTSGGAMAGRAKAAAKAGIGRTKSAITGAKPKVMAAARAAVPGTKKSRAGLAGRISGRLKSIARAVVPGTRKSRAALAGRIKNKARSVKANAKPRLKSLARKAVPGTRKSRSAMYGRMKAKTRSVMSRAKSKTVSTLRTNRNKARSLGSRAKAKVKSMKPRSRLNQLLRKAVPGTKKSRSLKYKQAKASTRSFVKRNTRRARTGVSNALSSAARRIKPRKQKAKVTVTQV